MSRRKNAAAVQVGDRLWKLLIEACLELFETDFVVGIVTWERLV